MTREWAANMADNLTRDVITIKSNIFKRIDGHPIIPTACKLAINDQLVKVDYWHIVYHLQDNIRELLLDALDDALSYEEVLSIFAELNLDEYVDKIVAIATLNRYIDSVPMEFDGDIIITDPCYFMKELDESTRPAREEFMLDDYSSISDEQYQEDYARWAEACRAWRNVNPSDWEKTNCGTNMSVLGFKKYMVRDTLYGDWSCTTYNTLTKKEMGTFCADAGTVGVFCLNDIMAYNPDWKNDTGLATLIKDFKGTVQFVVTEHHGVYSSDIGSNIKAGDSWTDYQLTVVGKGINKITGEPIEFVGSQTGF